jgi:hypothetical protein
VKSPTTLTRTRAAWDIVKELESGEESGFDYVIDVVLIASIVALLVPRPEAVLTAGAALVGVSAVFSRAYCEVGHAVTVMVAWIRCLVVSLLVCLVATFASAWYFLSQVREIRPILVISAIPLALFVATVCWTSLITQMNKRPAEAGRRAELVLRACSRSLWPALGSGACLMGYVIFFDGLFAAIQSAPSEKGQIFQVQDVTDQIRFAAVGMGFVIFMLYWLRVLRRRRHSGAAANTARG